MPPAPGAAVQIDPGIGPIIDAADKIFARREKRKNEAWAELTDDIDAIAKIVTMTDQLYIRLLGDIQDRSSSLDGEERARLVKEVHYFIHDERILQLLTNLNERVAAASRVRTFRLKWKRYRAIANSLRSLERATDAYAKYLREIHRGKVQRDTNKERLWNLTSVLAQLEAGESEGELSLYDHCEEAIRNRRTDLIDAVQRMVGRSTQNIRELRS